MRLTIIPEDRTVYIDRVSYGNIDMSWVPEIDGYKVHALQWLDGEGEIELVNKVGPNVKITELGVFKKAIDLWNEKKIEQDKIKQEQLMEEERLKQEEIERVKAQFVLTSMVTVDENDDEEDELFYDIEELLKEI
jgi:hypothetical protein